MNIEIDTSTIFDPDMVDAVQSSARQLEDVGIQVADFVENVAFDYNHLVKSVWKHRKRLYWGVRIVIGSLVVISLSCLVIAIGVVIHVL